MTEDQYYDSILGPKILEPEELNDLDDSFAQRQAKVEFFASPKFKRLEAERMERSKPKEHEVVGFNRVYCPVYDRIRPEWVCANEHDWDIDEADYNNFEEE